MKVLNNVLSAAEPLLAGQVGIIPTDTVYGVAARASDQQAVANLYALKGRSEKPGTIIAASIDQLVELGIPLRYLRAVEQYWPNAISIIIPADASLAYLHLGKQSLALRVPADETTRRLLETTGPLLTSSANHPGETPAENLHQAQAYFGDQVDFYVDGGNRPDEAASTVIRVIDDAVEVLRQGAVKINERGEIES